LIIMPIQNTTRRRVRLPDIGIPVLTFDEHGRVLVSELHRNSDDERVVVTRRLEPIVVGALLGRCDFHVPHGRHYLPHYWLVCEYFGRSGSPYRPAATHPATVVASGTFADDDGHPVNIVDTGSAPLTVIEHAASELTVEGAEPGAHAEGD
jgi:hypothetical protein